MHSDGLAAAVEHLREARRYCRSDPEASRDLVGRAVDVIARAPWEAIAGYDGSLLRLFDNLAVGSRFAVAAPDVLRGYIDGAVFELEGILSRGGEVADAEE